MQFCLCIELAIQNRLLTLIFLVVPSKSAFDLLKAGIVTINNYFADRASIFVPPVRLDRNDLAENETAQILFGTVAKWLTFLRLIDSCEAYLIAIKMSNGFVFKKGDYSYMNLGVLLGTIAFRTKKIPRMVEVFAARKEWVSRIGVARLFSWLLFLVR